MAHLFAKCEVTNNDKRNEGHTDMIVMDLQMDNLISFKEFHMNMSYPKKIVGSIIKDETLKDRPKFRYKKVNIIMGPNASGKTSIGKMLMNIFNFMDKKQYERITDTICDTGKEAVFSIDFVTKEYLLYRVETKISPRKEDKYQSSDIDVTVKSVPIGLRDSYESCVNKINQMEVKKCDSYIEELEKIDGLSWTFAFPIDSADKAGNFYIGRANKKRYLFVLNNILRTLDPAISTVEKLDKVENAFVVRYEEKEAIIKDGKLLDGNILSSGTKAGIAVASMVAAMQDSAYGFYYCDEKFSYIHSDIEKAILSVMISSINDNEQLFFTTHNTNVLDLPLPKHSFTFLKKDINDEKEPIKCISASSILKRNTDSLKNAVENDLFSVAPNIDLIYSLVDDEKGK